MPMQNYDVVAGDAARLLLLLCWTEAAEAEDGGGGRRSLELRKGKLYSSAMHGSRSGSSPYSELM